MLSRDEVEQKKRGGPRGDSNQTPANGRDAYITFCIDGIPSLGGKPSQDGPDTTM